MAITHGRIVAWVNMGKFKIKTHVGGIFLFVKSLTNLSGQAGRIDQIAIRAVHGSFKEQAREWERSGHRVSGGEPREG
jgi:hypothetical protein